MKWNDWIKRDGFEKETRFMNNSHTCLFDSLLSIEYFYLEQVLNQQQWTTMLDHEQMIEITLS